MSKTKNNIFIIPTFCDTNYTINCIKSLKEVEDFDADILVVDASPNDRYLNKIKSVANVTGIKVSPDKYWTGQINQGLKYAIKRSYSGVILVNNDNVFDNKMYKTLISASKDYPNSILCSHVKDIKTKKSFVRGFYYYPFIGLTNIKIFPDKKIYEVDACGGMGIYLPRSVIESNGLYDEWNFPHIFGDVEYYLRWKRKGNMVYLVQDAIVYNDFQNTGTNPNNVSNLKELFFSIKSSHNIHETLKFYKKYCRVTYPAVILKIYLVGLLLFYYSKLSKKLVPEDSRSFGEKLKDGY